MNDLTPKKTSNGTSSHIANFGSEILVCLNFIGYFQDFFLSKSNQFEMYTIYPDIMICVYYRKFFLD